MANEWRSLYQRKPAGRAGVEALASATPGETVAGVMQRAKVAKPIDKQGGDRKSEKAKNQDDNVILIKGNAADYLTRRIARDHPEILDRMKAGETAKAMQERGELAERGRPKKMSQPATFSTLEDLGLTRSQSSHYQPDSSPPEADVRDLVADAYKAGRWGQPLARWWRDNVTACWYRRLFITQPIYDRCEAAWRRGRQESDHG